VLNFFHAGVTEMMQATVNGSARVIGNKLQRAIRKQIPFAASQALNDVGKLLLHVNKRNMKQTFDKPVPYTMNAFYVWPAHKAKLSMSVIRKEKPAGKHYLEMQRSGGIRPRKAIETMMMYNIPYPGIINTVMPTRHSTMASGAISTARVMEAIAGVGGTMPNRPTTRTQTQFERAEAKFAAKGSPYYLVEPRDGKVGGINKKVGKRKVVRVFQFLDRGVAYRPIYKFEEPLRRNALSYFPSRMKIRLKQAYATMRI